jgi:RimJ/RimL family protein N-acetyltransferase
MTLSYEKYNKNKHYSTIKKWFSNPEIMNSMDMKIMKENELRNWLNDPARINLLFKDENENLIGTLNFYHEKTQTPDYEIGYLVDPLYQGKGYATKIVELSINFAKNQLNARSLKEIYVKDFNVASRKTLEKNGFIINRYDDIKKVYYYHIELKK